MMLFNVFFSKPSILVIVLTIFVVKYKLSLFNWAFVVFCNFAEVVSICWSQGQVHYQNLRFRNLLNVFSRCTSDWFTLSSPFLLPISTVIINFQGDRTFLFHLYHNHYCRVSLRSISSHERTPTQLPNMPHTLQLYYIK